MLTQIELFETPGANAMQVEAAPASEKLASKTERLQEIITSLGRVVVAYSGGVDSSLVLKVAHDCLGDNVMAVTAISASLASYEQQEMIELASSIGVRHQLIETHEVEDPEYAANPANRCYFCKREVYTALAQVAQVAGYDCVVDGFNVDDTHDIRPGQKANRELGIRSPLKEAGFTKQDVRALARQLGLPNWDKPALACLSSRVPYGQHITAEVLHQIDQAESFLLGLGLQQVRLRHHKEIARLEVMPEQFDLVLEQRDAITTRLQELGYDFVCLDLVGFQSGSMNRLLSRQP